MTDAHLYDEQQPVRAWPDPIGYVVLARRGNPYREHPWDYWTVSGVLGDLEQAKAQLKYDECNPHVALAQGIPDGGPVEYVVGQVTLASTEKPEWKL